ncbi:hypothetical protein B0H13DRAFT_2045189 [Mycena leptocephala]|nr:hypothetical protein B0H13DRAFT_2045189 [Mycena leptocephala]
MGKFDQTIGFVLLGVVSESAGPFNTLHDLQAIGFFSEHLSNGSYYVPVLLILELQSQRSLVDQILGGLPVHSQRHPGLCRCVPVVVMFYCVTNFANPQVVGSNLWPYPFTSLSKTTAVLAITNQMFQMWRIYKLTRNKIFIAFLMVSSLAACGMGAAAAIEMSLRMHGPVKRLVALMPIVEGNLVLQCFVDVIIAVHLSLIFSGSKTSFARTDMVLNILIRNAVQSGSFTAIFALGTALSFRLSSDTSMLVLFSLPIGRIYTHTIMDQLVSREELTAILMRTTSSTVVSNSNQVWAEHSNGGTYAGGSHQLRPAPVLT